LIEAIHIRVRLLGKTNKEPAGNQIDRSHSLELTGRGGIAAAAVFQRLRMRDARSDSETHATPVQLLYLHAAAALLPASASCQPVHPSAADRRSEAYLAALYTSQELVSA
jgi:hypothetical protein